MTMADTNEPDLDLNDAAAWRQALEVARRRRIPIVCSGKRTHGRITLCVVEVSEDGDVLEVNSRDAAFAGGLTDDGATVANRAVVPAASCREDHNGVARWRFTCAHPRCSIDRPMRDENLRRVIAALVSLDTPTPLDVSLLPR